TVLETHGHQDHTGAVPQVRDAGYDVLVTAGDAHMLPSYDQILEGDSAVEVGRLRLLTTITPGHTAGSICFKVDGSPVLFTGDTLFPGGPGLTRDGFEFREGRPPPAEFPCGDFATIIGSIDELIFARHAPETIVMPGHGDDTTIGRESPHLQEWIDRGW
ncbi:MAG: MBL fold metallo-hydrolase, partial [bacterium]|nr:MBL fold metallo-hydrolase [bacterium]